jgi:hypothetical protein
VKNHFAHFAKREDRNLYFTHGCRGEDLLAIGPWADGHIGRGEYRYAALQPFLLKKSCFQGGRLLSDSELSFGRLVSRLMGGTISDQLVTQFGLTATVGLWRSAGLVHPGRDKNDWLLTAMGSWLLPRLLEEARDVVDARRTEGDHTAHVL